MVLSMRPHRWLLVETFKLPRPFARQECIRTGRLRFSSFHPCLKRSSTIGPSNKANGPSNTQLDKRDISSTLENKYQNDLLASGKKELVPLPTEGKALDTSRNVDVPMKVLPKAQLGSNVTLSPLQRLHIEHITRRNPKRIPPKAFKEKLLIYHAGHGRVNWLSLLRVAAIVGFSAVTFIVVPAHVTYGTDWTTIAFIWAAGFFPLIFINWTTRPIAAQIWLHLPPSARQSAKAALDYAKNLPRDALLHVNFFRSTALMGEVQVRVCDTQPLKSLWRPVTFRCVGKTVDPGSFLRPNPTEFFVRPESAGGKAARDTIPGLWSNVYKRLAGTESEAISKWRK